MLIKIWDFFFHRHSWIIHEEINVLHSDGHNFCGRDYILKCLHCGKLKFENMRYK